MAIMTPGEAGAEPSGSETLEELFAALESPLLQYALRLAHEREAAEDIVQEAFMKLHRQFDEVREPRKWLYRTVHNLALNTKRDAAKIVPLNPHPEPESQAAERSTAAADPADPLPLPDEQIARLEGIGLVRLSLDALDERSREVIHLKFNEDLSYKEISARTGLTSGHVGYLLHHALKAIAGELAKHGVVK